jgi:DNA-directed RNA polymerase subunit RPC12/RpoP
VRLLRSYLRQFKPNYARDQQRRAFQKKQWRKRVDAQMRGPGQRGGGRGAGPYVVRNGTTFYRFPCQRCNAPFESPASENVTCPKCGFQMWVRAGVRSHSVGSADSAPTTRSASTASELERLAELHRSGALTDDEFATAKAHVLSQS